uniref:Uncharacterized protein n=1 Tax=Lactuca sativa TaxID=4236 RepID=A0A9R1W0K1_LACSA|nr:hypothetical protein LSAT_V11C400210910 [Lactuca sativa]
MNQRDNLKEKNKQLNELESSTGLNEEVHIKQPFDTQQDLGKDNSNCDHKDEALCILKSSNLMDKLNKILQSKDQDIVNAMNQDGTNLKVRMKLKLWIVIWKMHNIMDTLVEVVYNLHHYQVVVFKEVIDIQLQEHHCFNKVNTNLLLCIACLFLSGSFNASDLDKIMKMAILYRDKFPTEYDRRFLEVELANYNKDVREYNRFNDLKSIGDPTKKMAGGKKHIIFPKIYLLVKLTLILLVATSMERAFQQ